MVPNDGEMEMASDDTVPLHAGRSRVRRAGSQMRGDLATAYAGCEGKQVVITKDRLSVCNEVTADSMIQRREIPIRQAGVCVSRSTGRAEADGAYGTGRRRGLRSTSIRWIA